MTIPIRSAPSLASTILGVLVAWSLVLGGMAAAAETRIALVIANTNYAHVPALPNTENDAREIGNALERLGFEVDRRSDLSNFEFREVLREFRRRANEADVSLVYYAGHGMEIDRANFLVPVDAVLDTDTSAEFEAVPLDLVTLAGAGARRFRLVILDACRNNPFLRRMTRSGGTRAVGTGLAAIEPASSDMLVAYSAREGTVAFDGTGSHSPFARALLDNLAEPGLEIGSLFREVRDQVLAETGGAQEPFVYGSLSSRKFYLNPPVETPPAASVEAPATAAADPPAQPAPVVVAGVDQCRFADVHWQSVLAMNDVAGFEEHLRLFPQCPFASLARIRIDQLSTGQPRGAGAGTVAESGRSADDTVLRPAAGSATPADPVELAALAPPPADPSPVRPDPAAVQRELARLGCYGGGIDGRWGPRSARALAQYQQRVGRTFALGEGDPALLADLAGRSGRICALDCGPLFAERGGACVRVACPAGETLRGDGTCRRPAVARKPASEPAAPVRDAAPATAPTATADQTDKERRDRLCGHKAMLRMSVMDRRRLCGINW